MAIDAVVRSVQMAARGVTPADVTSKGKLDVVTTMDVAVEELIRAALGPSGLAVVGEESGGRVPGDGAPYWLVDPICGTRNFASGIPLYAVNVALVEGGRVTIGVTGDPSTGDVGIAELGRGAWALNGEVLRPLRVSDGSETLVVETGRVEGERREEAARFTAAAIRAGRWELRALSTTLTLPYVAAGRVSGYVLFCGSALHTGAGCLLASEAGALVTDVDGAPWTIRSDSVIAVATRALHDEVMRLRAG